jgi:quercetin dioxygenase-like cupin family protein
MVRLEEIGENTLEPITRRNMLAAATAGSILMAATTEAAHSAEPKPQPSRPGRGGTDPGPRNLTRDVQNPDLLVPPSTDHGTLPNLRFSFSDAHMRLETGGWTRQVTVRELGISKSIAGVDMRLNTGGVRELHWHKAAEWAYMLYGSARITAIDPQGRNFVDDVGVGDLWYFPAGIPHSIQGLGPDGCEFLLVFDDGAFDEDDTFLLSDQAHAERGASEKLRRASLQLRAHTRPKPALHLPSSPSGPSRLRQDRGDKPRTSDLQLQDAGPAADQVEERNGARCRLGCVPGLQDYCRSAGGGRARGHARAALAPQYR